MFETLQESGPLKFLLAFLFVLALIGVVAWVVRRFGAERFGGAGARGRQPRLGVVDKVELGDGRRRLVIIRRDNVEHLVMIGGPTDVVVEQNIVRAMGVPRDKSVEPTLGRAPAAPDPLARPVPLGEGNMFPLQPAPETNGRNARAFPEEPVQWTWPAHTEPQRPAAPEPRVPRADTRSEPKVEPRFDPLDNVAEELAAQPAPKRESSAARTVTPPTPRPAAAPVAPAVAPVEKTEKAERRSLAGSPDQHLTEMANRLEASLRRNEPRLPEPPESPKTESIKTESMVPPTARMTAPEPRINPPEPKPAAAAPEVKPGKALYESLEEEMASLLGRPPGKT